MGDVLEAVHVVQVADCLLAISHVSIHLRVSEPIEQESLVVFHENNIEELTHFDKIKSN